MSLRDDLIEAMAAQIATVCSDGNADPRRVATDVLDAILDVHARKIIREFLGAAGMQYRPHRSSLADAMAECVTLPATISALRSYVGDMPIDPETVSVALYDHRLDSRIGWWETYIVTAKWHDGTVGPIGFTDRMPENSHG